MFLSTISLYLIESLSDALSMPALAVVVLQATVSLLL